MDTKDMIRRLRTEKGLSQDELAEKLFVTRQAVSRWENGETTPNTETLKQLSRLFDVSINTLLGAPRQLVCQCCGMPLEDAAKNAAVRAEVQKWVDQANEGVSRAESVRKFIILPEEFTQENGLMTASMKVIRPKVIKRYSTLLNTQMYTKRK